MADKIKYFDIAIGESQGNGGDIQQLGNDIAIVYGRENQVFLAWFGGNVDPNNSWWGNDLLYGDDTAKQFNSSLERTLYSTELSSSGRIKIENAAKDDLKFLVDLGATVTVTVTLPKINTVRIEARIIYSDGERRLTIVEFGKRFIDGDFSIIDFNEDFF